MMSRCGWRGGKERVGLTSLWLRSVHDDVAKDCGGGGWEYSGGEKRSCRVCTWVWGL